MRRFSTMFTWRPIALVLTLALVAAACGSDGDGESAAAGGDAEQAEKEEIELEPEVLIKADEGGLVGLPDGSVQLDVPPGALAEDTTISVSEVRTADYPEELADVDPVLVNAVYEFEPDGLEFEEPAEVTIRSKRSSVDVNEGRARSSFLLSRSSDGEWEALAEPITEVDLADERSVTTAKLTHFSKVIDIRNGTVLVITPKEVETKPGSSWRANVVVQNLSETNPIDVAGEWGATGVVEGPGKFEEFLVQPGEGKRLANIFECPTSGPGVFEYSAEFDVDPSGLDALVGLALGGQAQSVDAEIDVSGRATCRANGDDTIEPTTEQDIIDELPGDCFRPKEGEAACVVDVLDWIVEVGITVGEDAGGSGDASALGRAAGTECEGQGVRVTAETDTDLESLDSGLSGEVVMQIHPEGESNDGGADSGVGMSYRGGSWSTFAFGPGESEPAEGTFSARVDGTNAVLELGALADGGCILESDEMRLKFEMAPGNDRIYDQALEGLQEYAPINAYLG